LVGGAAGQWRPAARPSDDSYVVHPVKVELGTLRVRARHTVVVAVSSRVVLRSTVTSTGTLACR
jgi:hypothetical protein